MKRHALNLFTLFTLLVSLIGSFASVTPAYAAGIVVNTSVDEDVDNGSCSLREAITAANTNAAYRGCPAGAGSDAITFAGNYTITLSDQLPSVTTIMTITGNGAANTIVQASTCNPVTTPGGCSPATYRVFEVGSTGDLALNSLTVRHGRCTNACATITTSAGGILNDGALTVTNSTVSGNFSNADGGGIYNRNATLTVTNSTLSGNSAYTGGGILNTGMLTVTANSTFSDNAAYYGGGINNFGTLTVTNSTLTDNFVNLLGGGIFNELGTVTVTNSTISGNATSFDGGGIYNQDTLTLTNSTLSGNAAIDNGGGIYNDGTLTVTNSTLSGNTSSGSGGGGGIFNIQSGTTLEVYKTAFLNNSASTDGGAINNNGDAVVTISNSTFSGNSASGAGGGVINNNATANIYNSTFSGNTSDYGGAFATWSTPTTVISNTIMANSTGTNGDCWNGTGAGTLTGSHNIIESSPIGISSCSAITTSTDDPALGSLTGSPAYFPLNAGSPAIDAGSNAICAAAPVGNTSQNGVTRPVSAACDIGSFELLNASPTSLVNSVLPTSRTPVVGSPVTIFNTVINAGAETAVGVTLAMNPPPAGIFSYFQTNCATNAIIGGANPSINIAPSGVACYVLSFTPSVAFPATAVHIRAQAGNAPATNLISGVNTWLLRATASPGPDIIALTTLTDFHQVACSGTNFFAVAMSNVGANATGDITVSANTGSASLPISVLIQETNPGTGAVIGDNLLNNLLAGQNRTVLVSVTFNGCILFDPAANRIFIEFRDASNNIVGSTSTAVSTNR